MRSLLIGAAAVALAASTAFADPGKGQGNGGKGGGSPAASQAGGGNSPGAKGGESKGGNAKAAKAAQGNAGGGKDRGAPDMRAAKSDRGPARQADRGQDSRGSEKQAQRTVDRDNQRVNRAVDASDRRDKRGSAGEARVVRRTDDQMRRIGFDGRNQGLIDGCPPGLAKKNNGCTPPGLAKDRDGYRDNYYRPSWFGYSSAGDGRYLYDDGYLYRTNDRGSILGYIPLLGGALSVGNPWPSYYQPVPVPDYYVEYYNLGNQNGYRYADDVLYRVNPETDAITSIAALLTGDQFGVGQRMPAGYDVYNVPYAYRDQYNDNPQSNYRYADGYVYQVDPTTQLIQAAIQLLT